MPGSDISIVVPTYNEAAQYRPVREARGGRACRARLGNPVRRRQFARRHRRRGARRLARSDDRVRLVLRIADRGLAKASIQGMLSAKGDLLCVMDGDGQHDPETIKRMIAPIRAGEAEIVSAARQLDEGIDAAALGSVPPQPVEARQPAQPPSCSAAISPTR